MKKTPLYDRHCKLGGKIIEFGNWALPVQYTGIIEEHERVRSAAGLFDVSHMGEIIVTGPDAAGFIQRLVTNNILRAEDRQVVYSPMCYPDGGVVDDLLVYRYSGEYYLLVVNASNTDKDFEWIMQNIGGQARAENVSADYAQLAIQGPRAGQILQKLVDVRLDGLKFFHFLPDVALAGKKAMISRTGYTGEDGFEIYTDAENAPAIWDELLLAGKDEGLVPAGLGARDTLRFEAALPLYGQEISRDISPLEAGLGMFVKLDKEDFIGREALAGMRAKGLKRRLAGFEMIDRGIARSHYEVYSNGKNIGFVTTGSYSPSLKKNIGMALIETGYTEEGTEIEIAIRDKTARAVTVKLPFYTKMYKK